MSLSEILPPDFPLTSSSLITSLWSNYGHIHRLTIATEPHSLILKSIHPPPVTQPSESHRRKVLSYEIERWFYHQLACRVPPIVKLARAYRTRADDKGNLLLEDLVSEFPYPAHGSLGKPATLCVLRWLAGFHGTFFGAHSDTKISFIPPPSRAGKDTCGNGVWERGTYWYLDTRREELEETDEDEYGWLMPWIEKVNDAVNAECQHYGTLLHGDVKGANIVFNHDPHAHRRGRNSTRQTLAEESGDLACALYDLQYVGLGLPTHDLVYFLGTSVESSLLTLIFEQELLAAYHNHLIHCLPTGSTSSAYALGRFQWHWELAIVDWYRFMAGWGFWGNDQWVERRAREIVAGWEQGAWRA